MTEKDFLRAFFLRKREKITEKRKKSLIISEKFFMTDIYKKSKTIMLFYPLKNEVNTLFILEKALNDGKSIVFPVTDEKTNEITPVYFEKGFTKGAYKIFEPTGSKTCDKQKIDVSVLPALSADNENYRLGYGGGCYDRFLKDFNQKKVTLLFKELKSDKLPHDEFDIKTDFVITD